jgi:hypothetical protein
MEIVVEAKIIISGKERDEESIIDLSYSKALIDFKKHTLE